MTTLDLRRVVVLDTEAAAGRRLAETVEGAGFRSLMVNSVTELSDALASGEAPVAVMAYEALFPLPQKALRELRRTVPTACLVVVHVEQSPRIRLGERLWAMSLMDYFLPRSSPPHLFTPLLRQAYADAMYRSDEAAPVEDPSTAVTPLRLVTRLGAALLIQRSTIGVLRILHAKLPSFIPYDVFEVLTAESDGRRLYLFQTQPVDHEVVWELAERTCETAAAVTGQHVAPADLEFIEGAPVSVDAGEEITVTSPIGGGTVLSYPLVVCGEYVGCLTLRLIIDAAAAEEHGPVLRLVSQQVGAALRCVFALTQTEQASLVDELTGAYNRRHLRRVLEEEWARTVRYGLELSVAVIDLDHFKSINDSHGHLVGDRALRTMADGISSNLRETDTLARYGGDEFVLVLPQTGAANAAHVIERMRSRLSEAPIPVEGRPPVHLSFSAGVACFPNVDVNSVEELLEKADEALLSAKRAGRSQVHVSSTMFGMVDEITEVSQGAPDQRRYRRLRIAEPVSCLPVVELDVNALPLRAIDVSEGGVQVAGLEQPLATDSHALVYFAGAALPRLAQVVWSTTQPDGTNRAGLRFVTEADLRLPEKTPTPIGGKPKALVVVRHPVVRDIAERVLKSTRYETHIIGDEGAVDLEKLDDVNLLVIGESALRAEFGRTLQESRSRLSPSLRIVLLNETATRRDVLDTVWRHHVEHMVAKDTNQEEALFTTLSKLLLGSYFGIRKYLLWGASTRSWQITDKEDKLTLFDEIRVLAASVHCHPRIADLLVAALDEMLINALYLETDAQRRRPVTVEYGSDGRLLAIAVIDPYGTFEPHALYSALGKSLEQEETGLPLDADHGNLGFRTMFMALSHLVVNVDPGRRTEMIGLVDLRKSLREYRRTAPSLGVFAADKRS